MLVVIIMWELDDISFALAHEPCGQYDESLLQKRWISHIPPKWVRWLSPKEKWIERAPLGIPHKIP